MTDILTDCFQQSLLPSPHTCNCNCNKGILHVDR